MESYLYCINGGLEPRQKTSAVDPQGQKNYLSFLKGEGHSKNCVFFSITSKKFTLSWVTQRCFSFWSGCDPNEKEVKSSTLGAAILKGSWRPGRISVTSFSPNWHEAQRLKLSFSVLNSFIQLWAKMLGPGLWNPNRKG